MQTSNATSVKVIAFSIRSAIALVIYAFAWAYIPAIPDDRLRAAGASIGGASGTLLGFLIAAVSIIASSGNRKFVGNMAKVGIYQRMVTETLATCVLLLASALCASIAQFFGDDYLHSWICSLIFLSSLGLMYLYDAGARFKAIICYL